MSVEAENHVLRVQVAELSHHLQSLNDIIAFMHSSVDPTGFTDEQYGWGSGNAFVVDEFMNNSLSYLSATQPILASSVDTFMY
uniref:ATB2 n=1 Tax=Helianthus petiolaris TaxID=4234 RepID=F5AKT8_HELPE|nr:ATB2 [Helianthus petiolaris]AEB54186.1 ATB2 [Helianthus petiolaris]